MLWGLGPVPSCLHGIVLGYTLPGSLVSQCCVHTPMAFRGKANVVWANCGWLASCPPIIQMPSKSQYRDFSTPRDHHLRWVGAVGPKEEEVPNLNFPPLLRSGGWPRAGGAAGRTVLECQVIVWGPQMPVSVSLHLPGCL